MAGSAGREAHQASHHEEHNFANAQQRSCTWLQHVARCSHHSIGDAQYARALRGSTAQAGSRTMLQHMARSASQDMLGV